MNSGLNHTFSSPFSHTEDKALLKLLKMLDTDETRPEMSSRNNVVVLMGLIEVILSHGHCVPINNVIILLL